MEPQQQIAPTNLESMNYIGPSMNPIFKPGDRLRIISYDQGKIRAGDVVVFISPEDGSKVVHRVISVNSDGIRTRGDNSYHEDAWVLSREHIIGRVVVAQRGNRRHRVFGGPVGQLFAAVLRVIHAIDSGFSSLLHPVYKRLSRSDIFRRWLPGWMKTRAISLIHPAGTELQLLMGRRVVGRWLPGRSRWHIRRPFRLFVDEASLPENTAEVSGVPREADQLSVANKDI
ncbi:MAG: S26 family signal peptidase [Deltaproteobacteria bacterium]|nr:MAG: S26 family signal peptidase [Deltaproteobacteria bacterium]